MQWEQILLIIVLVWVVILSRLYLTVRKRVAQLEKQPPQHTHKGDEVLFEIPGKER